MIEEPQIVETTRLQTAIISLCVPRSEIQNVMGPGYEEIFKAIAEQGNEPVGRWFTHHLRIEPGIFDFEISVPVKNPIIPSGRVKPGEWPAMRVARTVYTGPYEGLGEAWGEFKDWVKANGHSPAKDLWERYLVGPEAESDPGKWRTELNQPLN